MIQTIKLTHKQLKRQHNESHAFTVKEGDDWKIYIPYRCSTRIRLHELGHVKDNTSPYITVNEFIRKELSADLYSFDKMGKSYSQEAFLNVVSSAVELAEGKYPHLIIHLVIHSLDDLGLKLNKGQFSTLWQNVIYWSKKDRQKRKI